MRVVLLRLQFVLFFVVLFLISPWFSLDFVFIHILSRKVQNLQIA